MYKRQEGRSVDFIKLPNGNKISPYGIINLFEEIRDLKHFQIIQRSDFSLDVYLTTSATIVRRKNSLIGEINHTLRNELEDSIDIRCKIVELIEVGKGEKCRFVRSELSMQEM